VLPSAYGLLAARTGAGAIPYALCGAALLLLGLHEGLLWSARERAG